MGKTYKNNAEYVDRDKKKGKKVMKSNAKPKYKKYLSED